MKIREIKIKYKNRERTAIVYAYEESDSENFILTGKFWKKLSDQCKKLGSRSINVPEPISEGFVCYKKGWYKLKKINGTGVKSSGDAYCPTTQKIIQIKSSSIEKDLSSFGPNSEWDELWFIDTYNWVNGNSQEITLYQIDDSELKKIILNKTKNETFQDQQNQGRRPRLSIKEKLISQGKFIEKETIKIKDENE